MYSLMQTFSFSFILSTKIFFFVSVCMKGSCEKIRMYGSSLLSLTMFHCCRSCIYENYLRLIFLTMFKQWQLNFFTISLVIFINIIQCPRTSTRLHWENKLKQMLKIYEYLLRLTIAPLWWWNETGCNVQW
jgi:hypothetical protein